MSESGDRLGAEIAARREGALLTQRELADRVGVHYSHISLIESGQRDPSLRVLGAIAYELGARLNVTLVSKREQR